MAMFHRGDEIRAEAWGPGADRALAEVPARGLGDALVTKTP